MRLDRVETERDPSAEAVLLSLLPGVVAHALDVTETPLEAGAAEERRAARDLHRQLDGAEHRLHRRGLAAIREVRPGDAGFGIHGGVRGQALKGVLREQKLRAHLA